jgi:hypothetical protein
MSRRHVKPANRTLPEAIDQLVQEVTALAKRQENKRPIPIVLGSPEDKRLRELDAAVFGLCTIHGISVDAAVGKLAVVGSSGPLFRTRIPTYPGDLVYFINDFGNDLSEWEHAMRCLRAAASAAEANGMQARGKKPVTARNSVSRPARPKKSTIKDEARDKLIAAFSAHHQYGDGGCLNWEHIGNNELARRAKVSKSTASGFFVDHFKGYATYKVLCARNSKKVLAVIKALNGDFCAEDTYADMDHEGE